MTEFLFVASACVALSAGAASLKGPEAWLNFMGGNVRKDGLRCDLEAIKEAGISE